MRVAVALSLLILLVLGGLWLLDRADVPAGPTAPAADAPQSHSDAGRRDRARDGDRPSTSTAGIARREDAQSADAGPAASDGPTLEVAVLAAVTRAPVPGALVRCPDPEFDWAALSRDRRGELMRLRRADPEAFLEEVGLQYTTNADGRCRVPVRSGQGLQVCARDGDWFGLGGGADGETTLIEVQLRRDRDLRVRLLDARRAPVAEQSIAIERIDENGAPIPIPPQTTQTDAHGRCSFAHVQCLAGGPTPVAAGRVRARIFGGGGPERRFDFASPPDEEIVLVLGPAGAITVRVLDREGQPVAAGHFGDPTLHFAAFASAPSDPERRSERLESSSRALGPQGTARIAPVILDRYFEVTGPVGSSVGFAGPTASQPDIEVVLRQPELGAILTGRILSAGEPLAAEGFELHMSGPSGSATKPGRTDADGRFRVHFDASVAQGPVAIAVQRGVPWERHSLDYPETVEATAPSCPPGVTDLGELALIPTQVVVAGRLTGSLPRLPRVVLGLERKFDDRRWRRSDSHIRWDPEGGFVVRADIPPGAPVRLVVRSPDSLPVAPVEVPAGTTDVEIRLRAAAAAEAWFLTDQATPVDFFRVGLQREDGPDDPSAPGDGSQQEALLEGSVMTRVRGPDHRGLGKRWSGLEPGSYRLSVASPLATQPLVEFPNLVLPPGGQCSDPRLREIDLRRLLEFAVVRVVAADGAALPDDGAFVVVTQDQRDWPVLPVVDGVARVPITATGLRVLATAPDYLALPATIDSDGATLALRRAPDLTLRTLLPAPMPDAARWRVELRPTAERFRNARLAIPRGVSLPGGARSADRFFAASARPSADGVAVLRLRVEGPHTAVALVGRTTVYGTDDTAVVPQGTFDHTFRPDPQRLAEALAGR